MVYLWKTQLLTVIPFWYYCQKQCFSEIYQNGITFETIVFKLIFRLVFQCTIKLTMSLKTLLLTVLPKRYYCQSSVFKEIPKWYYFLSYCFQCNNFKIVFLGIFKLTSVCQNSVSDSNTKTVLPSEAVLFQRNTQMVLLSNLMFSKSYFTNCFPT